MHVILPSDDEPMKVSFDVPRTGFKKKIIINIHFLRPQILDLDE